MLVLSYAEQRAGLVRLRPRSDLSLYDLCKQVAADLGSTKHGVDLSERGRDVEAKRAWSRKVRRIDKRLAAVREELDQVKRTDVPLADAVESAARSLLGATETEEVAGTAGLAGYRLRVVRPVGPPPASASTTNSMSGTAHGGVVQAAHISGDVHIHQARRWWQRRR